MAFNNGDSPDDARECPVCYECLSGTERTLSCGHVFCHDCLVKTLVTINRDGNIRDKIVCPVCRHLTFIKKHKEALVVFATDTNPREQILEVPIPVPQDQRPSTDTLPRGGDRIAQWFRQMSDRVRRHTLIRPNHNACQIFIISAQGRPMAEEDALGAGVTVVQPRRRRRFRICTTARCLLCLMSVFTVLALVAATFPWILLA
ncbi:RING finger protein 222 [Channa argus]|uniref:RING finger protein 222 n=1 Tax=Channa argus TaxID=215402 RepID=UPI002944CF2B|nr:hypothetical protein Q8A73_016246 [Channa argus]